MKKRRSLTQQARHAISAQKAFGQKKHAAPKKLKQERLYSFSRTDGIRNVSDQFMGFVEQKHPDIKLVRELTNEHTAAWMKSVCWDSGRSFDEYRSRLAKLQNVCEATYGKCFTAGSWATVSMDAPKTRKIRSATMARDDFAAIRDSIVQSGRSASWIAMEITARTGLRVRECHCLSGKDINLEKSTVYVCREGAKNGRARTVPIRPQDREFFKWLKERTPVGRIFLMRNGKVLKPESIDSTIRRHMEKLGLSHKYPKSTEHTIRKMYAQERMVELRGPLPLPDRKAEMRAFDALSAELGHGANRTDLYKTYVLGK